MGGRVRHSPDETIPTSPRSSGTTSTCSADHLWSGQPNAQLVAQTADLAPGMVLDAGCGEGANAIWLARHGVDRHGGGGRVGRGPGTRGGYAVVAGDADRPGG